MSLLADSTGLFTASEVEARSGVLATTLRQWERRYGLPSPVRNASGYRLYSHSDLALIEFMCRQLQAGVPASRAAELARAHLALPVAPTLRAPSDASLLELVEALMKADDERAGQLLAEAHARMSTEAVLMDLVQPALVVIGERWIRGEITIAHEHHATAYLRARVSSLLDAAGSNARFGPLVVAAGGPQEHHEIGLLMLCVVLRRLGVQVRYLGINTPLGDLGVYARSVGAQAILLSVNTRTSLDAALEQRLDLSGPELTPLPVFVGGSILNTDPTLAAGLGQWAGPDAVQAAEMIVAALEVRA
ncbi:cobalamin B12-binding domain-containing protein [Deinococcus sp.]|uniref:MerR family transcriptional regulator n=1 Tax=Deinococcus sp. TaxID=47478 RepID=UPI0025FA2407|nr:cobalamin B12-binding domain-containing protein [Deinococcus sp.]